MRLFAIGDLHMSGGDEKPMDIFGPQWDRHFFRIAENWRCAVTEDDAVLIPGDISWAMRLEAAAPDLEEIGKLPGRKIICRGNHDYWWNSISRVRDALPEGMKAVQNDAADLGHTVVCGTRGWTIPAPGQQLSPDDEKIYVRETRRLRLALESAAAVADGRPVTVMTHFPPLSPGAMDTGFTALMEEFHVKDAVYGHLHGEGIAQGFDGEHNGVRYHLVSCDSIGFAPALIAEW